MSNPLPLASRRRVLNQSYLPAILTETKSSVECFLLLHIPHAWHNTLSYRVPVAIHWHNQTEHWRSLRAGYSWKVKQARSGWKQRLWPRLRLHEGDPKPPYPISEQQDLTSAWPKSKSNTRVKRAIRSMLVYWTRQKSEYLPLGKINHIHPWQTSWSIRR